MPVCTWRSYLLPFGLVVVVLLLLFDPSMTAKNNIQMHFEAINCSGSPLAAVSCSLGKIATRRTINLNVKFTENIDRFYMKLLVMMPRHSGDFVLLNLTKVNGCDLLSNKRQVTLVMLWRTSLNRFGNFPTVCPMRKNTSYYVRGYRFDLGFAPAFNFETVMNVWFEFVTDTKFMFKGAITARIAIKGGRQQLEIPA